MQAAVLHAPRTALQLETVDLAEPRAGEALVRVMYAGVCRLSQNGHPIHNFLGVSCFAGYTVVHEPGAIKVADDLPPDSKHFTLSHLGAWTNER